MSKGYELNYTPEDSIFLIGMVYREEMTEKKLKEYLWGYAEKYRQIGFAEYENAMGNKRESED